MRAGGSVATVWSEGKRVNARQMHMCTLSVVMLYVTWLPETSLVQFPTGIEFPDSSKVKKILSVRSVCSCQLVKPSRALLWLPWLLTKLKWWIYERRYEKEECCTCAGNLLKLSDPRFKGPGSWLTNSLFIDGALVLVRTHRHPHATVVAEHYDQLSLCFSCYTTQVPMATNS